MPIKKIVQNYHKIIPDCRKQSVVVLRMYITLLQYPLKLYNDITNSISNVCLDPLLSIQLNFQLQRSNISMIDRNVPVLINRSFWLSKIGSFRHLQVGNPKPFNILRLSVKPGLSFKNP